MKYINVTTVVNSYNGFQNGMTNKSWGYLALLKGCKKKIVSLTPYEVDLDEVSNFLEEIFNLSQSKKKYESGRSLYVIFSNKWDDCFKDQGKFSPNIYDVAIWAYRRRAFPDSATKEDVVSMFANEFNIPIEVITNSFNTESRNVEFSQTLYQESFLKTELAKNGVDVSSGNIDAKKGGYVASPGEISRGPFVQPLYAALEITDYVIILQSDYYSLYGNKEEKTTSDDLESFQKIFYGAPGTGKSHGIKNNDDVKSADAKNLVFRTTFHPDSDYSTFVGAYKPTMRPVADKYKAVAGKDEEIAYSFVPQAFLQAYVAAWNNPDEKVFLVIEEINRGNCAQIFGDLFQLLDRNEDGVSEYPIVADMDLAKYLSGKDENGRDVLENKDCGLKDGKLKLPKNLYIWATMNTSDQSLFPIDSAFKRRWDWKYMPIADGKKDWKIEVAKKQYDWWQFLQKINEQIGKTTNSEDKKLGYYFCKTKDGIMDAETFVGKVVFYLWNDVFKDFAEEAGCVFKDADDSVLSFNKFYTVGEDGKTKVVEEKVELFLRNLDVEAIDAIIDEVAALLDEDGEDVSNIGNRNFDYAKYSINGQGSYPKGRVAEKAISLFVSMNPDMSDEDIVDTWLKLNIKVPNLVETSQMFEARTASSSDPGLRSRYKTVQMPNGHILYVSNQYNVERINEFISKVNSQDWNIHIEKIAV